MAKGPRGEKRPADVIGGAVKVMRIATGEEEETLSTLSDARKAAGKRGAIARAKALTPRERAVIASAAASARWKKN